MSIRITRDRLDTITIRPRHTVLIITMSLNTTAESLRPIIGAFQNLSSRNWDRFRASPAIPGLSYVASHTLQRLLQVAQQVVRILDAQGVAHERIADADLTPLLRGQVIVGLDGRLHD